MILASFVFMRRKIFVFYATNPSMEITPTASRQSFPLQSLISQASILCFCVLAALFFVTRRGTLSIDGFRSRRIQRDEERRHRSNKGGTSMPHTARESGCMGLACLALVPPLLHFLLSEVLFHGKTGSPKVLGNLDSVWVPESYKHRKGGLLVFSG
jgi:hypothetical protein